MKPRPRLLVLAVLSLLPAGCGSGDLPDGGAAAGAGRSPAGGEPERLEMWALGREGEVVQQLLPEFERHHPGLRIEVQQIPFIAAHEKLLTAFVGRSTPDVAQLGSTWIPEFAAIG
ncbi:MAG TPA: extracellular solute-binding protein, partial [Thermoanaerobaculia bacterium]|nr:extracellular solute-binding protein [Thermoanaerobaculia bacterium]